MRIQMVNPETLHLECLPASRVLPDGRIKEGDLDQDDGIALGYLIPQPIPECAEGFRRSFAYPEWSNAGDGTAAPAYTDRSIADLDAEQLARQRQLQDAAIKQAQDINDDLAARQAAEDERVAKVQDLRAKYRAMTERFCQLAGLQVPEGSKFADMSTFEQAVGAAAQSGDMPLWVQLGQLAQGIAFAIAELRRPSFDGDSAWDRI